MTGDPRSDGELIAGLPRQPELMGVLYERHAPALFRYLARRAGPAVAEDLLSEVFIAALSASSRVMAHDSGSALPWLCGIGLNVLRRHFRRQQPASGVTRDFGMDWDAVDDRIDAWAERGRLRAALSVLTDSDRELDGRARSAHTADRDARRRQEALQPPGRRRGVSEWRLLGQRAGRPVGRVRGKVLDDGHDGLHRRLADLAVLG
jgi:DNA-directed RNA polymerase specialized sigma24 family protein